MFAFLRKGVRKTYDIDSSTIGRGSFAKVRRCVHRETGGVYAVKTVYKDRLKKHPVCCFNFSTFFPFNSRMISGNPRK